MKEAPDALSLWWAETSEERLLLPQDRVTVWELAVQKVLNPEGV